MGAIDMKLRPAKPKRGKYLKRNRIMIGTAQKRGPFRRAMNGSAVIGFDKQTLNMQDYGSPRGAVSVYTKENITMSYTYAEALIAFESIATNYAKTFMGAKAPGTRDLRCLR